MNDTVIKNGRVLVDGTFRNVDVAIQGNTIARIDEGLEGENMIDAKGMMVLPGAIDAHVHFRDPGNTHKEDFETGSRAAVFGGVTTVFEMPNTTPTTTDVEAWLKKKARASEVSYCNFGLFFGATPYNLEEALNAPANPGLKIFMGCSTGDLLVHKRDDLEHIFKNYPHRICVHAEQEERLEERKAMFRDRTDTAVHSEIRDPECAVLAVQMAGELAAEYGRHLHVLHLSTREELDCIAQIRASDKFQTSGAKITCEVCPHHLFFDTTDYERLGNFVRMNPPLRSPANREAMWDALLSGEIDMVATDHAPHTVEEKERPYWNAPSGVPAVELVLPLMLNAAHQGRCTHEQVSSWLSEKPSAIYNIPKRGQLTAGFFADIVIVDPERSAEVKNENQHTKCGWSPWAGETITGWPVTTIVNGAVVVSDGALVSEAGGVDVFEV